MIFWDYSHPQYNASLDKLNSILHRNRVNILKIMRAIYKNSCNFARIACEKATTENS